MSNADEPVTVQPVKLSYNPAALDTPVTTGDEYMRAMLVELRLIRMTLADTHKVLVAVLAQLTSTDKPEAKVKVSK